MKWNVKRRSLVTYVLGIIAFCAGAATCYAETAPVCSSGVSEPPFLSYGVDPNVLLMIDNSGSMYDPAYIQTTPLAGDTTPPECYDESYDLTGATSYAGYFENDIWYSYDLTAKQFRKETVAPGSCGYSGQDSTGTYLCLNLTTTTPKTVTSFAAKGNFLNWAATSKFDIQKKILTGGKYDSANEKLLLESRGCGDRRFVKQVALTYPTGGYKLALGVRGPMEVYDAWMPSTAYVSGTIVQYSGTLYKAKVNFTSGAVFTAADWDIYKDTRWYPGHFYPAGASVYDVASDSWHRTIAGGTSLSTATNLAADTAVTWEPFHGTEIEIFDVKVGGFDISACQDALDELNADPPNLGQFKKDVDSCMGYVNGATLSLDGARQATINHSLQECWYYQKHGEWQPGAGTVLALENDCQRIYDLGVNPADISSWDAGYVCYGNYTRDADKTNGYIGRCWEPAQTPDPEVCTSSCGTHALNTVWQEGAIYYSCQDKLPSYPGGEKYECTGNNASQCELTDNKWILREICTGGGDLVEAGWTNDDDTSDLDTLDNNDGYMCVDQALKDYCNIVSVPEVIDPSDAVSSTTENLNAPALLIDSGVMSQLDKPLAIMKARIAETTAPEGLIQKNADQMRIGVMRFNDNGADTECDDQAATATSIIRYECPDTNRDGAKVISEIVDSSTAHTKELVEVINKIEANSWTPLGEAMFTAIGYYTQNEAFKCQTIVPNDFTVGVDPVQYWCQNNHIILITDGSSTADINSTMMVTKDTKPVPDIIGLADVTVSVNGQVCTDGLYGNTLLDNFTAFAAQSDILYPDGNTQLPSSDNVMKDKQKIKTHIVVSGNLRDTGSDECSPDVILPEAAEGAKLNPGDPSPLYVSTNYDELEENLNQVFADIRSGASAGSAASVISSSRGGEGAIYQAIFWPSKPSSDLNSTTTVKWAGEVHALFIDTNGYMYEDTDGDRQMTAADKRVIIYFDDTVLTSKGCYSTLNSDGSCDVVNQVDMDAVRYLWSATDWLAKISHSTAFPPYDANDQYLNREGADYLTDKRRRHIFTWNDLDNDGIVDAGESLPFVSKDNSGVATNWAGKTVAANRRPVTNDFNVEKDNVDAAADNAEVNKIVEWVRGVDFFTTVNGALVPDPAYRSRTIAKEMTGVTPDPQVVWRLGDVVHSTPTAVGRPMENLHLLYGDTSYAKFVSRWAKRRNMAYFGANDGMLHAVNSGFYDEDTKKFCLTADCTNETGKPELGAEMWAYVPYNLLPHLKCLTSPEYAHKFYVDQRPRVFDARIFPPDNEHPDGWGTVLVGSMRFGGARVEADRLSGDTTSATDNRYFTSSYFVLDITNPEVPPVLLGEYTMLEDSPYRTDLGFTTPSPTPVVMKTDSGAGEWYLLMGSGPTAEKPSDGIGTLPIFDDLSAMKAYSNQKPKVAVFPLKWLTTDKHPFRIPDTVPTSTNPSGIFSLSSSSNGFVSDMITVDFDLKPNYMTDAVYFGTVEHGSATVEEAVAGTASYDNVWDGQLYRIKMRNLVAGEQAATKPFEWAPSVLFNAGQPITGAPSVGTDRYNYWIYFGTGRFFDAIDKPDDAQQSFYGVKELTDCTGEFTWSTVAKSGLVDVSQILVNRAASADSAQLYCLGTRGDLASGDLANKGCLPLIGSDPVDNLGSLITYIAGSGTTLRSSCVDTSSPADGIVDTPTGKDGWYRDFPAITRPRERNVGQSTLLGGLLTFTTYQPYNDVCKQEGEAYLYGLYYQTGTAWYKTVFGDKGLNVELVLESISLGRGLATTPNLHVGSGEGPTAFIQTSTGEIIELPQTNLPLPYKTGRKSWQER